MDRRASWPPDLPLPGRPTPGAPSPPPLPPMVPGHFVVADAMPDVRDRLLDQRRLLISGHLDDVVSTRAAAELMVLDGSGDDPIEVHLSSPDGSLVACLALADTVDLISSPVHVVCRGTVGGAAIAVLVAAERRIATSFASFHLVEPRVESTGTSAELLSFADHHQRLVQALHRRIADATGQGLAAVVEVVRPGSVLDADEALRFGLVHEVQRPGPATVTPLHPRG